MTAATSVRFRRHRSRSRRGTTAQKILIVVLHKRFLGLPKSWLRRVPLKTRRSIDIVVSPPVSRWVKRYTKRCRGGGLQRNGK